METANPNPGSGNRGAFTRGWSDALDVLANDRDAYQEPEKNTWQSIGYRHGLRAGVFDREEMNLAWAWSIDELRAAGEVNVDGYNGYKARRPERNPR